MSKGLEICCDYCGGPTEYVDSSVIYGRSYGMIYLCRPCRAYVGVHRGTNKPLGRLAPSTGAATMPMLGWLKKWACPKKKRTSVCSMCPNAKE